MEIRGETIRFTKERNKNNKQRETSLEKDIQNLERELSESKDTDTVNLLENIDRKKKELEEIRREKIEGVMFRSRARWVKYGEKPTHYFANLDKRNSISKSISHLQNSCVSIRNQAQMLEETLSFYTNLYESKDDKLNLEDRDDLDDQHLLRSDFPNLTEVKLRALEGCLSVGELLTVLKKKSQTTKALVLTVLPPICGFFSLTMWEFFLLRSLNHAYENGELSITQRLGIITLLPKHAKGDKPKQFLKNWRSITLLNITYKTSFSMYCRKN